jgi:hypothetical protein
MSTYNPQTQASTAYDVLSDSTITGYFADVDEAIVGSDVIKGQYKFTLHPAYNAPNPVNSNSYTTIGLTQGGPMVVNLENSYIQCMVDLQLRMERRLDQDWYDEAGGTQQRTRTGLDQVWFIGWKSSIDAIQRYDLMVNSTPIYTQSFCGEESFIQYQTLSDLVKHSTPYIYTSYENASKMSPCVCGTYIVLKGQTFEGNRRFLDTINCKIPIKIPLSNFLILRDMKYLMSWMGKWELRLFFAPQNIVILPIHPKVVDKLWDSYIYDPYRDQPPFWHNVRQGEFTPGAGNLNNMVLEDPKYSDQRFGGGQYSIVHGGGGVPDNVKDAYKAYPEVKGWLKKMYKNNPNYRHKIFRGHERFIQFGDPIPFLDHPGGGDNPTVDEHSLHNTPDIVGGGGVNPNRAWKGCVLSLIQMQMYDVELVAAQCQIRMDINEMIKQKYLSEKPLTFPVSVLLVSRFTGLPSMGAQIAAGGSVPFTMVLCQAINNVDTLWILPFRSHFQHTVCYQPWINDFQLHAGEFGTFPVQPLHTYALYSTRLLHMRFNQYVSDALNVSGSHLVGFNRDLCYEFCPKTFIARADLGQNGVDPSGHENECI